MPDVSQWESYFDPPAVLTRLGLKHIPGDVVDFGCGYGTFTLAIAPAATGTVHALDIDQDMLDVAAARAGKHGIRNIHLIRRDFMQLGSGLGGGAVACALLFNILHAENPVALLDEARRSVRPGGRVGVIHWNHDPATPRGPPLAIRPLPEYVAAWAAQAGLDCGPCIDLPPYHYGFAMTVPAAAGAGAGR
jgi:ubiquinone/menaquinone biosynthesis C-methylase UbiE